MPKSLWPIKVVHSWFREIGRMKLEDVDNITMDKANNFTQLAWARVQFIGCAGAKLGRKLISTCYYYPKGNIPGQSVFIRGKDPSSICTRCENSRNYCSKILTGLCGLGMVHCNFFKQ